MVYHIYPRSFKDANNDGIGDLGGIVEKLDYLRELGVGAIWLSPIYKSPMADFGYDISDYCAIDPIFGSLKVFKKLVEEAHKRDLKIIMDYVPNHTSDRHPWFILSRSKLKNPKRDWYIWKDPKADGSSPNNWLAIFGDSVWEFDEKSGQYYLHSFLKSQPDLNWRNPKVVNAMLGVLEYWIKQGVDGFRIDAFEFLIKDKRFLDEPKNPNYIEGIQRPRESLLHCFTEGQPQMFKILGQISRFLAKYPGKFMVTESYAGIDHMVGFDKEKLQYNNGVLQKMYRECLKKNHAPFNFQLMFLPWEARKFEFALKTFESGLPPGAIPIYVLGNHDNSRLATRLGSLDKARTAAMLQLTLPGMPFIYFGEELGMEDVKIPKHKMQDPLHKTMPLLGKNRDPQRTPMQWDKTLHAGFSQSKTWLPVAKDYQQVNVKTLSSDKTSIFNLYKKLISIRNSSKALRYGAIRFLNIHPNVLSYERFYHNERLLVVLNFSKNITVKISGHTTGTLLLSTYLDDRDTKVVQLNKLQLRELAGYVFTV